MAIIGDRDKAQIQEQFKALVNPVKLIYFTQELECQFCRETGMILREVSELSGKLALEVLNFQLDRDQVQQFQIDKIPATVVMSGHDYGIRFYGIPSGYEFLSLLDAVLSVSKADSGLRPESKEKLHSVSQPLHLQVLVTPT
jgi:glutaredoxin-like protein